MSSLPENPALRQVFGPSLGGDRFGQRLLERARQLDPSGFERRKRGPSGPIRVGSTFGAGKLLRWANPVYPAEARKARIQGTVAISVLVRIDGSVEELGVVSGPPLLVPAAREAVRHWRYAPTLLEGEPVAVVSQVDVSFTLSQ
jgi:protein TonB